MQYHQSLRRRITFSFALFGALLSMLIASGVDYALEEIEDAVVEKGLRQEFTYFAEQGDKVPGTTEQISSEIVLYYVDDAHLEILPDPVRKLPLGQSNFKFEGQLFYTLTGDVDGGRVYIIRDATAFERREIEIKTALVVAVFFATLAAAWLGNWLSARVIRPVTSLARQVSAMRPGEQRTAPIADRYADDEVGQLARTFDNYLGQMEQFVRREQEFTADASHELRTPLAIINGAAELLRENPELSERALKQVDRIARAGERMHNMLEMLLLLARETPSGIVSTEQCSVADLVQEIVEQHRFLCEGKPLKLRSEIIEEFTANCSKIVLAIVLSNLTRNAIQHTDSGEVVIRLKGRQIDVIDSGAGIPAEMLEHIFDRHVKGPNSRGSGIGLAIVKRICDRQKWQIELASEAGKGTRVTLII